MIFDDFSMKFDDPPQRPPQRHVAEPPQRADEPAGGSAVAGRTDCPETEGTDRNRTLLGVEGAQLEEVTNDLQGSQKETGDHSRVAG